MNLKDFQNYCWEFYGPNNLCGEFFDNKLTRAELDAACVLQSMQQSFGGGDSVDRENVRDILITAQKKLNHYPPAELMQYAKQVVEEGQNLGVFLK